MHACMHGAVVNQRMIMHCHTTCYSKNPERVTPPSLHFAAMIPEEDDLSARVVREAALARS